jgi:geranylgeranyl reductase
MTRTEAWDCVVVGGGPAGATVATDLAAQGLEVLLLEKGGRIKPCGGAIPPKLVDEFAIPDSLLAVKINAARMVAPSGRRVDMPINGGYVGMVNREEFDPWLRARAQQTGAQCRVGTFTNVEGDDRGRNLITYRDSDGKQTQVLTQIVVGADGAVSRVARQTLPDAQRVPFVSAYHEIVESPAGACDSSTRCDVYYQGSLSPDFYGWIFPHGSTMSVGVGTAVDGYSLRQAVARLRTTSGLHSCKTRRREGAMIPLRPLKAWDNGRNVILAGDAAGVVAPASGEGIYYAMCSGRLVAEAVAECLRTNDARALAQARQRFMRTHGRVFWILGMMQYFWYRSDERRERFVNICSDADVQYLTWQAYMHKALVRAKPLAHVRIFFKDLGHLTGLLAS